MKQEIFVQCLLVKGDPLSKANTQLMSWIPQKLAVVGKKVTVEDIDGIWEIVYTSPNTMTKKDLHSYQQLARQWRAYTDV